MSAKEEEHQKAGRRSCSDFTDELDICKRACAEADKEREELLKICWDQYSARWGSPADTMKE